MARPKSDPTTRFFSKVLITDDCWLWQGGLDNDGYGLFQLDGKQWRAHRYSQHIHNGLDNALPVVMHTCDNPRCVNPNHLQNGTVQDNSLDKISKGRHKGWTFPNHWKKGKKKQSDGSWK
ncbi:hypothetical protein UFOVP389_27 [uncultured Caudovirales phage]|uniref:HNH nuclease n=1 Tax=uncultured Caudovirales phage TaxID=2100421 RepID=A0A6J7X0R4_9CAUD|nr:hypothetical protein UFOVP389_27 [uncultured Caudovirales phage]